MIPYGVFVLTAIHPGNLEAAAITVHWVTQTAFEPCMIAVSVPATHPALAILRATSRFALHMLGKDDRELALRFGRPSGTPAPQLKGAINRGTATLGGHPCSWGRHATLLLASGVAVLECETRAVLEAGDHFPVIGQVIDTHVRLPKHAHPGEMMLHLREMGETMFHAG